MADRGGRIAAALALAAFATSCGERDALRRESAQVSERATELEAELAAVNHDLQKVSEALRPVTFRLAPASDPRRLAELQKQLAKSQARHDTIFGTVQRLQKILDTATAQLADARQTPAEPMESPTTPAAR